MRAPLTTACAHAAAPPVTALLHAVLAGVRGRGGRSTRPGRENRREAISTTPYTHSITTPSPPPHLPPHPPLPFTTTLPTYLRTFLQHLFTHCARTAAPPAGIAGSSGISRALGPTFTSSFHRLIASCHGNCARCLPAGLHAFTFLLLPRPHVAFTTHAAHCTLPRCLPRAHTSVLTLGWPCTLHMPGRHFHSPLP